MRRVSAGTLRNCFSTFAQFALVRRKVVRSRRSPVDLHNVPVVGECSNHVAALPEEHTLVVDVVVVQRNKQKKGDVVDVLGATIANVFGKRRLPVLFVKELCSYDRQ